MTDAFSILKEAILNEQDGYKFYTELTTKIEDERGRKLFQTLAGDEEEHLRILQVEYGKVSEGGEWLDLENARAERPPDSVLRLFPVEGAAGLKLKPGAGDLEALELAMDFERRAYEIYDKAARQTSDLTAQAVLRYLANWEDSHYSVLQGAYDYLANKGMWYFDEQEYPFFEG